MGIKIKGVKNPPFSEPTAKEVEHLFISKGIKDKIEPQKFMAYYQSNGWYVGRSKMRSWRAAVAGWVLRMDQFKKAEEAILTTSMKEKSTLSEQEKMAEIRQIQRAYQKQKK